MEPGAIEPDGQRTMYCCRLAASPAQPSPVQTCAGDDYRELDWAASHSVPLEIVRVWIGVEEQLECEWT